MYTEVIQDAVIGLMKTGKCKFASGCSLTVSPAVLDEIYKDIDFFRDKIVLRPGEISNSPEVVRRLGLITINTALEADIFGNINSTHVTGNKMMNGIGGSQTLPATPIYRSLHVLLLLKAERSVLSYRWCLISIIANIR